MCALVVDDSRAMRMILAQILRKLGFEVVEAGNGREGLERLRERGRPELALVDWNMPDMNGLEFVRAVRADPAYAGLRLVMVTGEEERAQTAQALEAGADAYVLKPFTRDTIQNQLEQLGLVPAHA